MSLLGTIDSEMGMIFTPSQTLVGDEIHTQEFAYHKTVGCIETPFQGIVTPFYAWKAKDHL